MYEILLSACGNPDKGEDPNSNIVNGVKVRCYWAMGETIDDVVKEARRYIERFNLGAGNWNGGKIILDDYSVVGYMSYNGRVWSERR